MAVTYLTGSEAYPSESPDHITRLPELKTPTNHDSDEERELADMTMDMDQPTSIYTVHSLMWIKNHWKVGNVEKRERRRSEIKIP